MSTVCLYIRVPAGQPGIPISVLPGCNDFLPDTGNEIPVPDYVTLTGTSDSPLVVYQPSTDTDWELWRATKNPNGSYSACWGGKLIWLLLPGCSRSPMACRPPGSATLPQ